MFINSIFLPNIQKNQGCFNCMDIFSPSGMILRSLINKTSKNRIPNFSISFFSKVVQRYIEHNSTEATSWVHCEIIIWKAQGVPQ